MVCPKLCGDFEVRNMGLAVCLRTCKAREGNPTQWMTELLSKLPDHPANRVLELLPLGSAFSFFQWPFKVIFEHTAGLDLAAEILCSDTLLGLKSNKWFIFGKYIYL